MAEFKQYGIEYGMGSNAERWTLTIMATSPEDAMVRVKAAAAWGQCYTPYGIYAKAPNVIGPLVRWGVKLRNLFQ